MARVGIKRSRIPGKNSQSLKPNVRGSPGYTTHFIPVIVRLIWIEQSRGRIKLSEEQRLVLNHFDIPAARIYLAWEEVQWDLAAVYPVRFGVRTCLAPEIFISAIVSQSFSACARGDESARQVNKGPFLSDEAVICLPLAHTGLAR